MSFWNCYEKGCHAHKHTHCKPSCLRKLLRLILFASLTFKPSCLLTLFIPSNTEWVTSPSPSNVVAKMSRVGVGQEKPDKKTFQKLTLQCCHHSDTISLSSSLIYSESSTHPLSHHLYACCHPWKEYIQCFRETNVSVISNCIFADLSVKTTQ